MLSLEEMRSETYQWTSAHSEEPEPKKSFKNLHENQIQGSKLVQNFKKKY
jgi:hypothetical protein